MRSIVVGAMYGWSLGRWIVSASPCLCRHPRVRKTNPSPRAVIVDSGLMAGDCCGRVMQARILRTQRVFRRG